MAVYEVQYNYRNNYHGEILGTFVVHVRARGWQHSFDKTEERAREYFKETLGIDSYPYWTERKTEMIVE